MLNFDRKLNEYYNKKVFLSEAKRTTLLDARKINIERIYNGTKKLNMEGDNLPYIEFETPQGSMAFDLITSTRYDSEYDIDHALVYQDSPLLPPNPIDVRLMVQNILRSFDISFTDPPEARTNAVTIWYDKEPAYHVDFAIYKQDINGKLFHAGNNNWNPRDPDALTKWFNVDIKNKLGNNYEQLKKIIKLIKYWSKSNENWSLPSGLFLTVIVVNNYKAYSNRDDLSFIFTLKNIFDKMRIDPFIVQESLNPVCGTSLYQSDKDKEKMSNFYKRINNFDKFYNDNEDHYLNENMIIKAWELFFQDDFDFKITTSKNIIPSCIDAIIKSDIFYGKEGSVNKKYISSLLPIKIGNKIRFEVIVEDNSIVTWEVNNSGDDAENAGQIKFMAEDVVEGKKHTCIVDAAYAGNHKMICVIENKGNKIIKDFKVKIKRK